MDTNTVLASFLMQSCHAARVESAERAVDCRWE